MLNQANGVAHNPQMQWYLRHGAQTRKAARHCQDAGWYLFGALTFRQGLSGRREEQDGALRNVVKHLFEPDPMTPALIDLLDQTSAQPDEPPTEVQAILALAQQVIEAIDCVAFPGREMRQIRDGGHDSASTLLHTCWRFSEAVEDFCRRCEGELAAMLLAS